MTLRGIIGGCAQLTEMDKEEVAAMVEAIGADPTAMLEASKQTRRKPSAEHIPGVVTRQRRRGRPGSTTP